MPTERLAAPFHVSLDFNLARTYAYFYLGLSSILVAAPVIMPPGTTVIVQQPSAVRFGTRPVQCICPYCSQTVSNEIDVAAQIFPSIELNQTVVGSASQEVSTHDSSSKRRNR